MDEFCAYEKARLSLRLPWAPSVTARDCPELRREAILSQAATAVSGLRGLARMRRANLTNGSVWLGQLRVARRWVRRGSGQLEALVADLGGHFQSAGSSGPFFRAAGFVRALAQSAPLLGFKRRGDGSWWRELETQLYSDTAMELKHLRSEPCSVEQVLNDLLQVETLRFQATPTWDDEAGQKIPRFLDSAQAGLACLGEQHGLLPHLMFPGGHLLFLLLDRLDCRLWWHLPGNFWMRLLPLYTEAHHVRGFGHFHCPESFRALLRRLGSGSGPFRFVEVGASLGGCTWQVLTTVPGSTAVAIEPQEAAAAAMKATAGANGLEQRLVVHKSFVGEGVWVPVEEVRELRHHRNPRWERSSVGQGAVWLEGLLKGPVELMRVHVDGREETVLRSLGELLDPGRVKALSLAMWPKREDEAYDPARVAEILYAKGYDLTLSFLTRAATERSRRLKGLELIRALREGLDAVDTMTLEALPREEKGLGVEVLAISCRLDCAGLERLYRTSSALHETPPCVPSWPLRPDLGPSLRT